MKKARFSSRSAVAALGLGAALLLGAGAAQARDSVYWSVGVASPGVAVGVSNAYPAVVAPVAPVVAVAPAPVYYAPPPVVYAPRPVYYAPPVMVAPRGWYRGGHHHHEHGWEGHRR
ncbi:hypothetical protein [Extensimonas vulgaris]|uniref:PXPV repeat-containing protein n=1 Tax=Extensimonas vulgaris TaxID=1031594 RepID=A0A369ARW1_9BURK|nr:hypothetical protein [Extensimonas vulgaris]RCX11961.1 hypothetical protein DFR45_101499 [Extensimonas vulgaris]TWI38948.1 hypothetical protein IP95_01489 [Extensimonas vulgaris]TXD14954.1 hypothetical protein FUT63_08280 [Extensimonas vulgaris]